MSGPTPRRHGLSGPSAAPGGSDLVVRRETASQTAGPYVHIGLAPHAAGFDIFANNFGPVLVDAKTKGERIRIEGRVFDGIGTVLKDVLIEIWQANATGKYAHPADHQPGKKIDPHFRGWGRAATDFDSGVLTPSRRLGRVWSRAATLSDGATPMPGSSRAVSRWLQHVTDFSDEAEANAKDAVLNLIEWEQRRKTLVAERLAKKDKTGATVYRFDIRLQGEDETVFSLRVASTSALDANGRSSASAALDVKLRRTSGMCVNAHATTFQRAASPPPRRRRSSASRAAARTTSKKLARRIG